MFCVAKHLLDHVLIYCNMANGIRMIISVREKPQYRYDLPNGQFQREISINFFNWSISYIQQFKHFPVDFDHQSNQLKS